LFWYKEEVELLIKFWGSPQRNRKTTFTTLKHILLYWGNYFWRIYCKSVLYETGVRVFGFQNFRN